MDFDVIGGSGLDAARAKRLLFGYAAGALVCGAGLAVAMNVSAEQAPAPAEEEVMDVKLATKAEEKPPEPPPPPPKLEPVAAPRGRAALVVPKEVPTTAPSESDPKNAPEPPKTDPYGDGKGGVVGGSYDGVPGGTGTARSAAPPPPPPPPPPAPPPPPPPPKTGPVQLPENATPPVAISNPQPSIGNVNAVLAAAGVEEITIIVKFVVTESGDVGSASIARGNPALDAQVLATVKGWKFKPATVDGKPISVYKTVKFRFKLKT